MRDRIIAGVLALVAIGVVGGAFFAVTNREVRDPQAESEAAIDTYLDAWSSGDTTTMSTLVATPPADFVATHQQMVEALSPTEVHTSRGEVTVQGSQADADVTVEVDLPDADSFTWQIHVTAQRIDGEWLLLWEPTTLHPDLRAGWTFDVVEEPAGRAAILAHDGTPLTEPGELVSVGIEPRRIEDRDAFLAEVAALLPEGRAELEKLLARTDLQPTWFYPVVTVRSSRWEQVSADLRAVPGIIARTEQARVGSDDGFALHLLGRVGPADEERAEELGVQPGVDVGRYGVEAAFEDVLTGTPAFDVVLRDGDEEVRETLHRFQGDSPAAVTTTLDRDVQQAVENALVGVSGSVGVVVLDTETGAIRGSASRPLNGFNRAWEGRYPPGSTFKVVTALAALGGDLDPTSQIDCPAEVQLGGLRLSNAHDLALGTTTLEETFARSCNTTFATLATDLGADAMTTATRDVGFGVDPVVPLPAFGGSFPEPADTAELAAAGIGQARVEASPLQMASVAAAVAAGRWHPPFLTGGDPTSPVVTPPEDAVSATARPLNDVVVADLRQMMEAVVARGTGTAAQVEGDPPVAGKTGSAEFGTGDPKPTHAWFIGFRGDLAFAVLVEGGGGGGEVAAPIAARLLRELAAS